MAMLDNERYEKFAQELVAGKSQRQAYYEAFPNSKRWTERSVDNKASKLYNTEEIKNRIEELQEQAVDDAILSRKQRMLILSDISNDLELQPTTRIKAIDTLNKMTGEYVSKIEATVSPNFDSVVNDVAHILDDE